MKKTLFILFTLVSSIILVSCTQNIETIPNDEQIDTFIENVIVPDQYIVKGEVNTKAVTKNDNYTETQNSNITVYLDNEYEFGIENITEYQMK